VEGAVVSLGSVVAGDWALIDDLRTITLETKVEHGQYADPVTVTNVMRGPLDDQDLLIQGALLDSEACVFHVWAAKLAEAGAPPPKIEDRVTEGGVRRLVKRRQVLDEGQRFRVLCLKAR
jgi:hypothetical protein